MNLTETLIRCSGRAGRRAALLREALEWLDDYGMRMAGTADLVSRIREEIDITNAAGIEEEMPASGLGDRLSRATAALRFYADETNWPFHPSCDSFATNDRGERAREVLSPNAKDQPRAAGADSMENQETQSGGTAPAVGSDAGSALSRAIAQKLNAAFNLYAWEESEAEAAQIVDDGIRELESQHHKMRTLLLRIHSARVGMNEAAVVAALNDVDAFLCEPNTNEH